MYEHVLIMYSSSHITLQYVDITIVLNQKDPRDLHTSSIIGANSSNVTIGLEGSGSGSIVVHHCTNQAMLLG